MLVRAGAATLILAILTLVASALFWPGPTRPGSEVLAAADTDAVLAAFERESPSQLTIDVGGRYAGRTELLDPRETLPTWHRYPHTEAARLFAAARSCPTRPLDSPLADAALAKAYEWAARTCAGAAVDDLLAKPPFMHPSGTSYAAMARTRGDDSAPLVDASWRSMHVLELGSLRAERGTQGDEERALADLGSREWLALSRGDRLVLTSRHLVTAERGPTGLAKLHFHDRAAWDRLEGPLALVPRSALACPRTASSLLCWELTAPRRSAAHQRLVGALAAVVAAASVVVLGFALVRERRRAALDRLHLLRTLTHELRTPAMALGLDIEPLRASFDEVPEHLQEPLLRISGGIARLHRVLQHGARALELFEGKGRLASPIAVESIHELLADLAAEWPDGVTLVCDGDDGGITTDPSWLAVALRNLVENACKHGRPPVVVRARLEHEVLVVRVEDAGATPEVSLRGATAAWNRDPKSDGLGLGLALVVRIVKALGGTLAHEPRPTAFVLRIPGKGGA